MAQVVSRLGSQRHAARRLPLIAADIGGTYARLGLVSRDEGAGASIALMPFKTYRCTEYPSLAAIFRDFLAGLGGVPVRHCAIASAGFAVNGTVIHANLPWPVAAGELQQELQFDDVSLINDFAAIAYGAPYVDSRDITVLSPGTPLAAQGPQVLLGPGTGLGAAVLLANGGDGHRVLATEAGQAAFSPTTDLEIEILQLLRKRFDHVSNERVVSGPGLLNLYTALATLRGAVRKQCTPEDVTAAAVAGSDPTAREAFELFCGITGSVAGDLVLLYGAHGGVYVAGGILPRLKDFVLASSFMSRFTDKGAMRTLLEQVPVKLIEHGNLGVLGAARWYLEGRD